jgi:hypothetical protein
MSEVNKAIVRHLVEEDMNNGNERVVEELIAQTSQRTNKKKCT